MSSGIDMSFQFGRAKPSGDSAEPAESGDLFRVLVLGDFSGRASRQAQDLASPSFVPQVVDLDQFDAVMRRLSPALDVRLAGAPDVPIAVGFNQLEDFEPDALFARLPIFSKFRDLRARLANPATFEQAAAELRASEAPDSVAADSAGAATAQSEDNAATLQRLLGAAPTSDPAAAVQRPTGSVDGAVDRLLRSAVAPFVVPATSHLQQPMIESVDRAISQTMRALLSDPHWRALEGGWRGLDQFVRSVEMDGQVLLELVDASAADVLGCIATAQGDTAQTPLAKSLASRRRREGQEEAYALVVALYEFGPSAAELALLAGLGSLAAGEGAVMLGSAAAELALVDGADVWDGMCSVTNDAAAQDRWQALRSSWVAPHIGLVWPSLMGRLPYGSKTQPVAAFEFEELAGPQSSDQLPWRLAALDLAAMLARVFTEQGWDMRAESALELEDLPAFIDRRGDDPRLQAVAELFMSERQAQALGAAGVMALISHRTLPHARLAGWRSISSGAPELKARWLG